MIPEQVKNAASQRYHIKGLEKTATVLASFSLTERIVFSLCAVLFAISALVLLSRLNNAVTVEVPAAGGSLAEGVIGIPRFINPLLAISDADRDLTALVYSGLMKAAPDGRLIPDLAERYEMSLDGLSYTFFLRPDAIFQDESPVTANDVIFTIKKAQDGNLKSPRRASWEGVVAERVDDKTVKIMLKQPYAPFLENTTLGILPAHIWKDVGAEQFTFSQFNSEPVGSGPYVIKKINHSSGGIPTSYVLSPFKHYALGEAHISQIEMKFYASEEALLDAYSAGEVSSINSISPQKALALKALGARILNVSLPRIFGVFLNQSQAPLFTNKEVRQVLTEALDRDRIVRDVLNGYGVSLYGPLPDTLSGASGSSTEKTSIDERVQESRALLQKNGWKPSPSDGVLEKKIKKETVRLAFSLATSNTPELKAAARIIKENWERLGAKVNLNFFDTGDLNQNVIRPRKYDALFFGEIVGRDLDLFAFWHSSQRNDPGLNIALYTNIKADKLLEQARTTASLEERVAKYQEFSAEVTKDIPAVFIYSPDFIYVIPKNLQNLSLGTITVPSDRFLNVTEWYTETDRVWKLFANEKEIEK